MKLALKKGSTDTSILLFIQDSASTTGAGKTGLLYNTASLVCYYARPGAAAVQLALATQTVTGAHSDGGFVEVDATNMPGVYRLDPSDAILATGVNSVVMMLKGASGMAPLTIEIQLTDFDLNDADPDVNVAKIGGTAQTAGDVYGMLTAAIDELAQGIPPTNPTLKEALMLIYMNLRNQTLTTATEHGIYNNAGTKIAKASLSDDGTTLTKGKLASGA